MTLPLEGFKVLDLSRLLPGPLCTMHLADLGAEVLKVESPSKPDYLRFLEPYVEDQNIGFLTLNRNKKSLVVAYETPAGAEVLRRLVPGCDVLVESFRSGYLASKGLGYDQLRKLHPGLVYCSITAYGQGSSRAGHDLNCLALSGCSAALGGETVPNTQLADITCAMGATQAVLAALLARERGSGGAHLDLAMVDAAYHLNMLGSAAARAGVEDFHGGSLDGSKPYYRYYRCREGGLVAVGALEEHFHGPILEALGLESWEGAEELFLTRTRDQWFERLGHLDACVEPVLNAEEVLEQDWMAPFGDWDTPPGLLARCWSRGHQPCAPPGRDTEEVLKRFGFSASETERLRSDTVIG